MSDENYSMKRSRTQLATIYAPESFFTFEGGMGACIARPAARSEAHLSTILQNQIMETINARVQSWETQAVGCHRSSKQPPVEPELALDKQLRRVGQRPRLMADRVKFLVPDVMNYEPEPLTFVCRRCGLMKDFKNTTEFETKKDTLTKGCPHLAKQGDGCRPSWEQLDVVLVHWSGRYHRVSTLQNRWENGEVKWSRMRCHCGNEHFRLDRFSPVFSKWRLLCSACGSASSLPVLKDEDTLRVIGDGIGQGRNQLVEVNMEPVSYRANSAFHVQGDRVLAFANDEFFHLLQQHGADELRSMLAKTYGYPVRPLSETEIQLTLREKNRESEWLNYKNHAEIAEMMMKVGKEELAASSRKAQKDQLEKWRKDGLIPDTYEITPELNRAVAMRDRWNRKFDPIRQAVEHRTFEVDILNDGDKVINVKEPKDPILPDLTADDVAAAKGKIVDILDLLGIEDMRVVRKFPVCEFTFGYTRVESGPRVTRNKTNDVWEMPVRLNLFPRAYFHEEYVQPIYVMRQDNEALYVKLRENVVRAWLAANGIDYTLPSPNSRLGAAMIDEYDGVNPNGHGFSNWLDEYRTKPTVESRNASAYVYTLLHTMAHQLMHSVAEVSGLELGNMAEHIFLPDLAFVVYRRGTTMDLGYLSAAWRMATTPGNGNLILSSMLDPASLRCGSGALCDERGGACPDCILIPEVCCLAGNNLLSRSVLRGMARPHWDATLNTQDRIVGFLETSESIHRRGKTAA